MREGEPTKEQENETPEILYRAFTVDPEALTVENLSKPLVAGKVNEQDNNKIHDGNELGVYMSTNRSMVETAYAHSSLGLGIKSQKYKNRGVVMDSVPLPECGVIVAVDARNLPIRKPEILEVWQGHYNNGFEGEEWIADEVPNDKYKIVRLILSLNDSQKFSVDIDNSDEEGLKKAVVDIKKEFERRKNLANQYKDFLDGIEEKIRMNDFILERRWNKFQEELNKEKIK